MSATHEFFNVQPVEAALATLHSRWGYTPKTESLDPRGALGRVLATALHSPIDLPEFTRSAMDGFAVRAEDTFGASSSLPAYIAVIGRIAMGAQANLEIQRGQTVEIYTGGMLPQGANAVVMVEQTQRINDNEIEALAPVAPGENVIQIGEDISKDDIILNAGQRLRPQDIGGLLAVGITSIEVAVPPRVGILSCGDEVIPPENMPAPGQIRDINAYMLSALIQQSGGAPIILGIARDTLEDYLTCAQTKFDEVDMLVMTAGSSVSARDLTHAVINRLGKPGVLQHGLAVKPGKPTILAICDNKPVVGLPGNPVSALLVAYQIVVPLIKRALGDQPRTTATIKAKLASNIASTTGREDTIPVKLTKEFTEYIAEPVFGKSNLIFTLINADGLAHIPLNSNGLRAGTEIEVTVFNV
jgi:molybdopterin molybdotransferase